jgi:hypothetical protein
VLNVRNLCLLAVAALALGSPGPARAQALPPDQLFGGEVQLAVGAVQFGGSCYVNRGSSTFQRNGLGPKAVISFNEIVDSGIWELQGQAVLTFATATSGTIRFKRAPTVPPAVHTPPFLNYTQTYDPVDQRLVVTFSIVFPDCTLPVFAVFTAA